MLDVIDDKNFHAWSKLILKRVMAMRTDNTPESLAHNRANFAALDLLLATYTPLVSVLPLSVSIGLVRFTFSLKHCLENWEPYFVALEVALVEKFKPEKVKSLLRGLREVP